MSSYPFKEIEKKWQTKWATEKAFECQTNEALPKYYVLEMLPYPSGRIHMGHVRNYAIGDAIARFKKAQGFNVLHPIGWDAFGLPAENAAIQNKVLPHVWTESNIAAMREQLQSLGFSYDWSREISTCEPEYYTHEQEMFLSFYEQGLIERKESWVNWDPVEHSVLANEQVVDGKGWRSGAPVERRLLSQWFLKTTAYAAELREALSTLTEWPEQVRTMQEKWIGFSKGTLIHFPFLNYQGHLDVYTTRPETLFGASFCAIAFNHPLALSLAKNSPSIKAFIQECEKGGTSQQAQETAEKRGIDTGLKLENPFNKQEIPLYITNYVLLDYGVGAIFACPAHDERDFEFAQKYNLPIKPVICPFDQEPNTLKVTEAAYTGDGFMIHSDFLNGLKLEEAREAAISKIEELAVGQKHCMYRLRDWGVSRQRYWGCPIPMIHCKECGMVPVPRQELPVKLPENITFDTSGNPLEHHPTWKITSCPTCGKEAQRETDTLDTFFESSWYFLRYCSPHSKKAFEDKDISYWMTVDYYIGGIEHAVMHLLYSRFFMRALKKCGYVNFEEPFRRLMTQGMVCHETYKNSKGEWLFPEEVYKDEKGVYRVLADNSLVTVGRSEKMSKSKKNVVDPTQIIEEYGADTARLFMLSDSPPERNLDWSDEGIHGCWRFINKVWRSVLNFNWQETLKEPQEFSKEAQEVRKKVHQCIQAITEEYEKSHFNKAIAKLRELLNEVDRLNAESIENKWVIKEGLEAFLKMSMPIIPHVAEELWAASYHSTPLYETPWPQALKNLIAEETVTVAIQVNGKLRDTLVVPFHISEEALIQKSLETEGVQRNIEGKKVLKTIVIKNRVVNVVVQ